MLPSRFFSDLTQPEIAAQFKKIRSSSCRRAASSSTGRICRPAPIRSAANVIAAASPS